MICFTSKSPTTENSSNPCWMLMFQAGDGFKQYTQSERKEESGLSGILHP